MKRFLLFFLLVPALGYANDFEWTPRLQQAYTNIFKLKLTQGRQELAPELGKNGVALYLDDYADMLYLLLTEDRRTYEAMMKKGEERLEQVEDMDEDSPWNRALRAEMKLHWAFVKIKFGKEAAGAWDIIKAYKLLDENAKKFPQFTYTKKALGILHILIGSTPENYRWATKMLGLRGSIQQGIQEIRTVAAKEPLFREEAQLIDYLMQGYVMRLNSREISDFQKFVSSHDDNLLIQFFGNSMLMKEGHGEAALAIANDHPSSAEYINIPFFAYHKGEILLQKGQYTASVAAFQQFLKQHPRGNFIKDAYYKQSLCYELNGDESKAKALYEQIRNVGESSNEADKAAQKVAKALYKPLDTAQKSLLKARLASDGGYYDTALDALKNLSENNFATPEGKAEFSYRKARVYHRMNNFVAAIPPYERAIQLNEGVESHYGASSSLQLGYIYQTRADKPKAKQYFEKALSYKKHEYKNSVDSKAKAALNEMGL